MFEAAHIIKFLKVKFNTKILKLNFNYLALFVIMKYYTKSVYNEEGHIYLMNTFFY